MCFNFVKKWQGNVPCGGKASNKMKLSKKNAEFRFANIYAKTSNGCPARNGGGDGEGGNHGSNNHKDTKP
jgi:hypothetical protein